MGASGGVSEKGARAVANESHKQEQQQQQQQQQQQPQQKEQKDQQKASDSQQQNKGQNESKEGRSSGFEEEFDPLVVLPMSSFQSYAAEANQLYKLSDYSKAIEAYTKALSLRPGAKQCLVARSKCHLQLGNHAEALADAETALQENPKFAMGTLHKAEALYAMGDFEMALVFYYRGTEQKPEDKGFQLGIQKARTAILNCIGDPKVFQAYHTKINHKVKSKSADILQSKFFSQNQQKQEQILKQRTQQVKFKESGSIKVNLAGGSAKGSNANEEKCTVESRKLLGELYSVREYFAKLANDVDLKENPNTEVQKLAASGLEFLDMRAEFWRQQKPSYHRSKRTRSSKSKGTVDKIHRPEKVLESTQENKNSAATAASVCKLLSEFHGAVTGNDLARVVEVGQGIAKDVKIKTSMLECGIQGSSVLAHLYFVTAQAELELGNFEKGANLLELACKIPKAPGTIQRACLIELAKAQTKKKRFAEALGTWVKILARRDLSREELTCACHDSARSCFFLGDFVQAHQFIIRGLSHARQLGDKEWIFKCRVTFAQILSKTRNDDVAIAQYTRALAYAEQTQNKNAIDYIQQKIAAQKNTASDPNNVVTNYAVVSTT